MGTDQILCGQSVPGRDQVTRTQRVGSDNDTIHFVLTELVISSIIELGSLE